MALPQNMLDAQARNQAMINAGVQQGIEPTTPVQPTQQITGIANSPAPALSVSGQSPQITPPIVAPVSDAIKYGGNRVVGPNGEPNIGENGYGTDPFKLKDLSTIKNPNDAADLINKNQVAPVEDKPPLANGFSVSAPEKSLVENPTPKNPLDKYMEFLQTSLVQNKPASFGAQDTYAQLQKDADVTGVQSRINALSQDEETILNNKRQRQEAQMQNGSVPLDVAAGRINEIERQENIRLDQIRKEKNTALNELQTKNDTIGTIMKMKQYDYEQAKSSYAEQFSQQMQMMNMFRSIRNDTMQEESAKASAQVAAQKAQADALSKQRDDARANIGILYNNITSGGFDPMKMSKEEQVMWAQQEMLAGLPAGSFYNLASTHPQKEIKTQYEVTGPNGQRYIEVLMQDRKTGMTTVQTIAVHSDYKDYLGMKKLENEIANMPLDTMIKRYNITEKEQQIIKNKADIANIPYDALIKQLAAQKSQAETDQKINDTYELSGGSALGASPRGVHQFGEKYGAGVEANKSGRNQGTDFSVPVGTKVALPQGNWKVIGTNTGVTGGDLKNYKNNPYGNSVLVQNTQTGEKLRMSHLSDVSVQKGQTLNGGSVIGLSGATGNVSGPHLDLEYYNTNGKLDDIRNSGYAGAYFQQRSVKSSKSDTTEKDAISSMVNRISKMGQLLKDSTATNPSVSNVYNYDNSTMGQKEYNGLLKDWMSKGFSKKTFDDNFSHLFSL